MKNIIKVLEISVDKNGGETVVTLSHLLNIAKMVDRIEMVSEEERHQAEEDAYNSTHDGYGS